MKDYEECVVHGPYQSEFCPSCLANARGLETNDRTDAAWLRGVKIGIWRAVAFIRRESQRDDIHVNTAQAYLRLAKKIEEELK